MGLIDCGMTVNGKKMAASAPGGLMAHFPGTGPDGARCGGCRHFAGLFSKSGDPTGQGICRKAMDLLKRTGTGSGPRDRIGMHTKACKYFDK